jgi:hypothetical protein
MILTALAGTDSVRLGGGVIVGFDDREEQLPPTKARVIEMAVRSLVHEMPDFKKYLLECR